MWVVVVVLIVVGEREEEDESIDVNDTRKRREAEWRD